MIKLAKAYFYCSQSRFRQGARNDWQIRKGRGIISEETWSGHTKLMGSFLVLRGGVQEKL